MVAEEGAYALIGSQTGVGGNQLDKAIRLEHGLYHGFAQFHGGQSAAT